MKPDLIYKIYGKWILAGEHTVLRDGEALVFPLKEKYLEFSYFKNDSEFKIEIHGLGASDLELFIWSILEKALDHLGKKRIHLFGTLKIESHIEFGTGMGASAVLSVGLSEFFKYLGYLQDAQCFQFAKNLEDLFHGESSGVDVAVALYGKPLIFKKGQKPQMIEGTQIPKMYLSYSGLRGPTKDCVQKVKKLIQDEPEKGRDIDLRMISSVNEIKKLLLSGTLTEWIRQIHQAQSCFEDWGLVPAVAEQHISFLKKHGALACKMTGSGGGGFVLSLWDHEPPKEILTQMIRASE